MNVHNIREGEYRAFGGLGSSNKRRIQRDTMCPYTKGFSGNISHFCLYVLKRNLHNLIDRISEPMLFHHQVLDITMKIPPPLNQLQRYIATTLKRGGYHHSFNSQYINIYVRPSIFRFQHWPRINEQIGFVYCST